jgi:MFS family permease
MTAAVPAKPGNPLRQRNFTLLWVGDTLSQTGSQSSTIALPLLVLALTGSPVKAGLVGFARSLGYGVSPLPAGVITDRLDRRRVMIVCAAARALAMASVPVSLALGTAPLVQLMCVAFLDAALTTVSMISERGLLAGLVPEEALGDAVALNEARTSIAVVGGPPLGGALFSVSRSLPFVADAVSFVLEIGALLGLRLVPAPAPSERAAGLRAFKAEIREGAAWLWHAPFLRAGSVLYAMLNVTVGAVTLLGVLVARHHGASSASIGLGYAIVGVGGVISAVLAGPSRRRLSTRLAVLGEPWAHALFLPMALSTSVVVGQRLALTPDRLRGRVQAASAFISASISWAGPLAIGFVFQAAGETAAVLGLAGWAAVVALGATVSRGLRQPPDQLR